MSNLMTEYSSSLMSLEIYQVSFIEFPKWGTSYRCFKNGEIALLKCFPRYEAKKVFIKLKKNNRHRLRETDMQDTKSLLKKNCLCCAWC